MDPDDKGAHLEAARRIEIEHEDNRVRDAFAAAALTGLLSNPNCDFANPNEVVADAYSYAEFIMFERAKRVRRQ